MIGIIVLFQLVFAFIAYKIMSSQKELVWKSDINDYQLVSFKRGIMYWILFFMFSITPFIGILSTTSFLMDSLGTSYNEE